MVEEEKTYTIEELSYLTKFNKAYIKMLLKQLSIDSSAPLCEEDAMRVAERLKRPWPPEV